MTDDDLEWRIQDLEARLDQHHADLNESIEQRDLLALDAAWGILTGAMGSAAFLGGIYFVQVVLGWKGWIGAVAGVAAAVIACLVTSQWIDRGRFQDRDKLRRLPKWEARRR